MKKNILIICSLAIAILLLSIIIPKIVVPAPVEAVNEYFKAVQSKDVVGMKNYMDKRTFAENQMNAEDLNVMKNLKVSDVQLLNLTNTKAEVGYVSNWVTQTGQNQKTKLKIELKKEGNSWKILSFGFRDNALNKE